MVLMNKHLELDPDLEEARSGAVTEEDHIKHWREIEEGKQKELDAFMEHGVFERMDARKANNIIDSTWVLKWKWSGSSRQCRARLCLRGFKDLQKSELHTYASTASRISQRIICSFSAIHRWKIHSLDISTAFLQGHEYSDEKRKVQLRGDADLARRLQRYPGFQNFDHRREVLLLRKSAYGLVDAPKRWFEALTSSLTTWGWTAGVIDPAIFHKRDHDQNLVGILSLHVDDIKATGSNEVMATLISNLTSKFGTLKSHCGDFEHCGLLHQQLPDGTVIIHQNHYLDTVQDIPNTMLKEAKKHPEKLVDEETYKKFRTLLGQISWLVQSRAEAAVATSFLQSVASCPSGQHVVQISLLLKWLKRHRVVT
eukprot:5584632-Amphidinium_carterae.1